MVSIFTSFLICRTQWLPITIATNTTSETVNRGCRSRSFCQQIQANGTKCSDCEKNKCNDATGLSTSVAAMIAASAGVLIISRL